VASLQSVDISVVNEEHELRSTSPLRLLDEWCVPYERGRPSSDGWERLEGRATLRWPGPSQLSGCGAGHFRLGETPLFGRVLPGAGLQEVVAALAATWQRAEPIRDADGEVVSYVWRSAAGDTLLPFDPDDVVEAVRSERYRDDGSSRGALTRAARGLYYVLRPLLPRALQIALRRRYARVQERVTFPRWPVEPCLDELVQFVLLAAADAAGEPLPLLMPWPRGRDWAVVLTHDVEHAAGRDFIDTVRAVEERLGVRSSWNLVAERYEVTDALVEGLVSAGHEVGVHGLRHDGRDLGSRTTFERRLPTMQQWGARWGAAGFRSPATHRVWDWMPELGFDYDSSYPDTDPYEPIPGGCATMLPFFNNGLVELPITLPQDHTVFAILRRDESLWREKADDLRSRGRMALLITHPDYLRDPRQLAAYESFIASCADDQTAWIALPRDVAVWWRRREATVLERGDEGWRARGPAAEEAVVSFVRPSDPRPPGSCSS
jgi:peptidoglycan/xylan/chitin deacetylase (PgdA/CDA1 family)